MAKTLDTRAAAQLAIDEAAPLCAHPIERRRFAGAVAAFERGDYAEAICEAVQAAYVAGMGREVHDRNKSQGNRPNQTAKAKAYRTEIERLAALARVPAGAYDAAAGIFHKEPESVKRQVAAERRRRKVMK